MLLLLLMLCSSLLGDTRLTPYLQTKTHNTIWVAWKTAADLETKVKFGQAENNLSQIVNGNCQVLSANYYYHTAKLTGLQPDSYYYYQVISGDSISRVFRFKTAPLPGSGSGHLRFLIFGDHQITTNQNYETLLAAAKVKVAEKYGSGPIENYIDFIQRDGDQVDLGNLSQYENLVLNSNRLFSANLPSMTVVGNHETYGTMGLTAYYNHFVYDDLQYNGISSGTENYYAYQIGSLLMISISSEHSGAQQLTWLNNVIDAASADTDIQWIVSVAHRPFTAESYASDYSSWLKESVMPVLNRTNKHALFIAGHHHLYHRGQFKNNPGYHIISGAASWDQYWGQTNDEIDRDDVQKTIDNWAYQIVDIDLAARKMEVESYAIGGPKLGVVWQNKLIDSFSRQFGLATPAKPQITGLTDNQNVTLPYSFNSSAYISPDGIERNSTQFQISSAADFSTTELDLYRDFENLYKSTGSPNYLPVDQNQGVDIFKLTVNSGQLNNGTKYIRVRHRDKNSEWSAWSEPVKFVISGSTSVTPVISASAYAYTYGDTIKISYNHSQGTSKDWIGIYKKGQTPGGPTSTVWQYTPNNAGQATFVINSTQFSDNEYFAGFFANDGYTELSPRIDLYIGKKPQLTSDRPKYNYNEAIKVDFSNAPFFNQDWLGIYKIGSTPGQSNLVIKKYITAASGQFPIDSLPRGYYFASYFIKDSYREISPRIKFEVGDKIARITINSNQVTTSDSLVVNFSDGAGTAKDWMGIYKSGVNPQEGYLEEYLYVDGRTEGSITFKGEHLPQTDGDYFVVFFTNDSYTEISNRQYFTISGSSGLNQDNAFKKLMMECYPNPFNPSTTINFNLPDDGKAELMIYNSHGALVTSLLNKQLKAGSHQTQFNATNLPSGVYYSRLQVGNQPAMVKRMLLLK